MSVSQPLAHTTWAKSSYSQGNGGTCVEWAPAFISTGAIPVRDSKRPDGPALTVSPPAWLRS
ncbi:DUF397 domain-containing protein [Streptomyces sp. AV19]|uniref:DUF397 domain-containing protein n=1 Tax=Streptomyces sp. AV19 TaxID=2793068 RepID=UPI0018FE41AB|nr:DUF397 domain-containing protein [Streptomyces sp. AV19]MBH1935898.1 DUF397 domain-containing protein [Streptomyces sp. AV19]MDG4534319.1 DUF397 domain-containing protein [Streptomyces sp. AV19]